LEIKNQYSAVTLVKFPVRLCRNHLGLVCI